jgi:hypothetical protein
MGTALSCSRVYTVLMTHLFSVFFLFVGFAPSLSLPTHIFQPLFVAMSLTADSWISDFVDILSPSGTTSSFTTLGHTGGSFTAVGRRMEGIGLVDGEYEGGC